MRELALFAGAGGGILGGKLLGWRTVCAVEIVAYCRSVLLARQRDGMLDRFPIWDDVRTFDGRPWRGLVDVVTGGFPCQDISIAGRGAGIDGKRSGLWVEMARIIREVRPHFVFVENSPMLLNRGIGRVLGDLATMGFDARWGVLGADDCGAPHQRKRMWIVANANRTRELQPQGRERNERRWIGNGGAHVANTDSNDQNGRRRAVQMGRLACAGKTANDGDAAGIEWPAEPGVGRMAHGVAHRVDRLTALGNGQVPRVVFTAWRILSSNKHSAP